MSIPVSVARFHGKQRQEIMQEVQKQMQEGALQAIKQVMTACLEAEVTAKLGREKGEPRLVSSQQRASDWKCGHCGCQEANHFTRDGHYQRDLETGYGHLHALPIPMLECQRCHHDVICTFALLGNYERLRARFAAKCPL